MKKKIFTFFVSVLVVTSTWGQINPSTSTGSNNLIGEVKNIGAYVASCKQFINAPGDTSYAIYFNNIKYKTIVDIQYFSFKETGGDFDKLYNLIDNAFQNKEKKNIEIPLEKGILTLSFTKALGVMSMQFMWYSNGVLSYSSYLTSKQCKKLFGKTDSAISED